METIEEYRCIDCKVDWKQRQGPSIQRIMRDTTKRVVSTFIQNHPPPIVCIDCGHKYIKWLNYGKETRP